MLKGWLGVILLSVTVAAKGAGEHEHGVGHLYLVVEGSQLQLLLSLPADDLMLPSHSAAVNVDAQSILAKSPLRFEPEAGCRLMSAGDEYSHESHDEELHDEAMHETHADGLHENIEVTYLWHCSAPVSTAKVLLFQHFPTLQLLKVQIVSSQELSSQQKIQRLTPASPDLLWD